jgi:cytochrome c-type biogenesis protein CcmH/NrfF
VKKICFLFLFTFTYCDQKLEIEIKQSLVSPCCWAGTIYDLDHNPDMENKISELVKSGYSKNQVLDYFVNIHGERVLAVPKAEGFNTLVWIAPIVVVIGSLIFLSIFFSRQEKNQKLSDPKSELPYDDEIEKELSEMN